MTKERSPRWRTPALALLVVVSSLIGGMVGVPLVARAISTTFGVNVQDSGALCDGSHDDTPNFNTAFGTFSSAGGKLLIPRTSAGCKITSTLNVPRNVSMEGEAPYGSLIWLSSSSAIPAVQIGDPNASSTLDVHGNGLRYLQIQGNGMSVVGQVGVKVIKAVNTHLQDVLVQNVETGFRLDGGGSGAWTASTTLINPMTSNVKYGLYITSSGGVVTDTRCCTGGYFWGNSTRVGEGVHGDAMKSSQFSQWSVEGFGTGVKLSGTSDNDVFFGGRIEHSGLGDGSTAIVCDGAAGYVRHTLGGTAGPKFWNTGDMDVVTTAVVNQNSAACTVA